MGRYTRVVKGTKEQIGDPNGQLTAEVKLLLGAIQSDLDLIKVVDAWPRMPRHIKTAILALVTGVK
jgi:hypothetical protein